MYEHRSQPLLPRRLFYLRLLRHGLLALAVIAVSLLAGIFGYHFIEGLPWLDALLNASMILGGMGPVNELHTAGGKIFASFYAIYCGVILLLNAGVLFAPVLHRFLHMLHMETGKDGN